MIGLKESGSTLIELMISLVLSLTVIAGISSLFLQMQKSNRTQTAISDIMDDSRYALEILQKEIRYTGGVRARSDINGTDAKIFIVNPVTVATPYTVLGAAAPFAFANSEYIKGDTTANPATDSFMIRYQLVDQNDLNPANPSNSSSPCTQNSLLDTTNALDNPANPATASVVTVYFYVLNGSLMCTSQRVVINPTVAPEQITCRTNCALTDTPSELIGNVANLLVSYGVDSDADNSANYYVNAASVTPASLWPNVISLRINLVLKSTDNKILQTPATYKIDGVAVTATDKSLYRVFSTTIALRNQI